MLPQLLPKAALGKLRDTGAVSVRLDVLGAHVHGHFAQKQVRPDACRGGDARFLQHRRHELLGKGAGGEAVQGQVAGGVDEHLVDGVNVDVLRRHILQVNFINFCGNIHIIGHAGRRHDVVQRQGGV